ncbi:MAG TPA: hypothetical protein VHO28_07745 [Ignavibacteriales bacterium]|nr:hypothetical protein [Ignavibacteriales bacterium]
MFYSDSVSGRINKEANLAQPKINNISLIIFFALGIPMVVFTALKHLETGISIIYKADDKTKIEEILQSEKILNVRVKDEKLKEICEEFLSVTKEYGYTSKDIINEIKQH